MLFSRFVPLSAYLLIVQGCRGPSPAGIIHALTKCHRPPVRPGRGRARRRVEFAQGGRGLSLRPADRALDRIQVKTHSKRSQLTDDGGGEEVQTIQMIPEEVMGYSNTIWLLQTPSAYCAYYRLMLRLYRQRERKADRRWDERVRGVKTSGRMCRTREQGSKKL